MTLTTGQLEDLKRRLRSDLTKLKASRPRRGSDPTAKVLLQCGEVDALLDALDQLGDPHAEFCHERKLRIAAEAALKQAREDAKSLWDQGMHNTKLAAEATKRADAAEAERDKLKAEAVELVRPWANIDIGHLDDWELLRTTVHVGQVRRARAFLDRHTPTTSGDPVQGPVTDDLPGGKR